MSGYLDEASTDEEPDEQTGEAESATYTEAEIADAKALILSRFTPRGSFYIVFYMFPRISLKIFFDFQQNNCK